jgi:hypothetical protein
MALMFKFILTLVIQFDAHVLMPFSTLEPQQPKNTMFNPTNSGKVFKAMNTLYYPKLQKLQHRIVRFYSANATQIFANH